MNIGNYQYYSNLNSIRDIYESYSQKELSRILIDEASLDKLKARINDVYQDPDECDELLYETWREKLPFQSTLEYDNGCFFLHTQQFGDQPLRLSLDGAHGWKQLFDFYSGDIAWLDAYETIRGCRQGQLLWPKQQVSINQKRYQPFDDCVDLTLADVKTYYGCKNDAEVRSRCKLSGAYLFEGILKIDGEYPTRRFLQEFETFEGFVDAMGYQLYTIATEDKTYDVRDLHSNPLIALPSQPADKTFSERYLSNLIDVLAGEGEPLM